MNQVAELLQQAVARHQADDAEAAAQLYRRVLQAEPNHADARYLLATAELQLGRFDESIRLFEVLAEERTDVPDLHNNLGVAYQALGQWEEAVRAFQTAIQADSQYERAFFNMGALLENRSLFADAEKCFRRALELNSEDQETRTRLGNALKGLGRWSEAEECYRVASAHRPDDLELQVNLAFVLARQEKLDAAVNLYQQILRKRPDYPEMHNSLSYIRERQGRLDEAVAAAQRAIELNPPFAEGYNNLGIALRSQHRLDEACDSFRQALTLSPEFPLAEFNLGTTHLLSGNYREGWQGFEQYARIAESPLQLEQPCWAGAAMPGRRLLIHADQGFGDTLQFARFLPMTKERSQAHVIVQCQPELRSLFVEHPGIDELVVPAEKPPECDQQIALTSLAALFEVELNTIPADVPYLHAATELSDELQELLAAAPDNALKVGLAWQGNPQQARDLLRSCPLQHFRQLFDVEAASFFSLQTGEAADSLSRDEPPPQIADVGSKLRDFGDTAAVLQELDLLITVDTAVAHLAGALGRPVWTLLCHTPDWRWLLERTDSPWYPTMRLFRQAEWGDWQGTLQSVRGELAALAADGR